MHENLLYDEKAVFNSRLRHMPSFFCKLTSSLRIRPSVFIAGVQKGGTTSLFSALTQHPQIIPPKNKEPFYYGTTSNFKKGDGYYGQFFATSYYKKRLESKNGLPAFTIDATTNMFDSAEAAERILKDNPNSKIIFLFRNPVDRAFSHYKFSIKMGFEKTTFEKALELEEERIKNAVTHPLSDPTHNYARQRLGYFTRGIYANYIDKWLSIFPSHQLHFINSSDFFANPQSVYNGVTDFLGLVRKETMEFGKLNEGSEGKMKPETYQRLQNLYKPHNEQFFEMIKQRYDW